MIASFFLFLATACDPSVICTELQEIRPFVDARLKTCERIVEVAEEFKIDPVILVAVGWHESRFNNEAISRSGARGALQVLPRWWCGSQKCDFLFVGGRAFTRWYARAARKHKRNTLFYALAMYNGGNSPGARSERYARKVMKTAKLLRRRLRICGVPGC